MRYKRYHAASNVDGRIASACEQLYSQDFTDGQDILVVIRK
jgi:hypothetical protein